jgi:hypothetical protein
VVVAEEHRDEFRAVAQYLNDLAELDSDRGIAIWLVEARAVRIEDSHLLLLPPAGPAPGVTAPQVRASVGCQREPPASRASARVLKHGDARLPRLER